MPFRLLRVDARPAPGQSPEEAARAARYHALRSCVSDGEVLLTAHHQDDQAETLLLQLLRGAGPAGLAAMPERARCGAGFLLRPLLGFTRSELREFAEARRLDWIEDPSNQSLSYDRNFLRQRVMPVILARWPAAAKTLSRTARHCAEAQAVLTERARALLAAALEPEQGSVRIDRLREYSESERRLVLREWLGSRGFRMPSARVLERVLSEALLAAADRTPVIRWAEGEIRRYRNELYLLPPALPFDRSRIIAWDGRTTLRLPDDNGELWAEPVEGPGLDPALWDTGRITVRYRQGGETCRPAGRKTTREVKRLFQEKGIPPWLRERTPLIYIDERLAAVGGWWICEGFAGPPNRNTIRLRWARPRSVQGPCSPLLEVKD